jgi:hypothetical protein
MNFLEEKQIWLLNCFKCKSAFELEIDHSKEYVILLARKTSCPKCGHLPKLIEPNNILSAIEVHMLVGVKLPPGLETSSASNIRGACYQEL